MCHKEFLKLEHIINHNILCRRMYFSQVYIILIKGVDNHDIPSTCNTSVHCFIIHVSQHVSAWLKLTIHLDMYDPTREMVSEGGKIMDMCDPTREMMS